MIRVRGAHSMHFFKKQTPEAQRCFLEAFDAFCTDFGESDMKLASFFDANWYEQQYTAHKHDRESAETAVFLKAIRADVATFKSRLQHARASSSEANKRAFLQTVENELHDRILGLHDGPLCSQTCCTIA